jgi:hypothetical protein
LFIELPKIVRQGWPKENPHFFRRREIFGFLWVLLGFKKKLESTIIDFDMLALCTCLPKLWETQ